MSDILLSGGSYSISDAKPWEINFSDATDIRLPFQGTVIVPDYTGATPNFDALGTLQWFFVSLLYPEVNGAQQIFRSLRDQNNQAVVVENPCIILVADDHTFLDDVNFSKLFGDIDNFYQPVFRNNLSISSIPRYLLMELDGGLFSGGTSLPEAVRPAARNKDFQLINNVDAAPDLTALRTVLGGLASLSGKIRAFDQAGRQTEAYSAIRALGVDKNITGAPAADSQNLKLQFVDLHGKVLNHDAFPLNHLQFSPPITGEAEVGTQHHYTFVFPDAERKLKIRLKAAPADLGEDDREYFYHFHYVCLWPGYDFQFREVTSHLEDVEIDLLEDYPDDALTKPSFVRLCIFHPHMDFQSKAGGDISVHNYVDVDAKPHKRLVFDDNQFNFFSAENSVSIYNSGQQFFNTYYEFVNSLKAKDKLYQANWKAHPFLHLTGSMAVRGITETDQDPNTIHEQLTAIRSQSELFPVLIKDDVTNEVEMADVALLVPTRINGNQVFRDAFAIELHTVPGGGEVSSRSMRGFVRKDHFYTWPLKVLDADAGLIHTHRAHAYWRNSLGQIVETSLDNLFTEPSPTITPVIDITINPSQFIQLAADDNDPPRLQIRRTATIATIRTIASVPVSVPVEQMRLFVSNTAAGVSHYLRLAPPGSDATSTDVDLTDASIYLDTSIDHIGIQQLQSTFSATDSLFVAVMAAPTSDDALFGSLLHTDIEIVTFENDAFRLGDIPTHSMEVGGLLRSCINKEVEVRALFWEQNLGELSGGSDAARGLSNNESITNLINRSIDSKRGFAFRDRSMRDFGSWHQKATVVVKDNNPGSEIEEDPGRSVTAFLGGIDLSTGRWDTQLHFRHDPDRQSGLWYDIHLRIHGDAAVDVLKNFRHRWKAIHGFLNHETFDCRPVTTSLELEAEVAKQFLMPDPVNEKIYLPEEPDSFIQINRTMPPLSCFSLPMAEAESGIHIPEEGGELGSFESYKKAIRDARRFILINDQYFFNQEIALLLHERLKAPDGPDFVIIVLPKVLAEEPFIDPHLFMQRKMAIHTLLYGSSTDLDTIDESEPQCGNILPNPPLPDDSLERIEHKISILSPVNRDGDDVYVHSKHMIVDDVWMTIGSANINNRSLTYDMEINAAVVGRKLFKGGATNVRNHRIEICRQLLGVPNAYGAMLQDPYAVFKLCKAIEGQKDAYSHRVHPLRPMVKWLDKSFIKRTGDTAFDQEVDLVATLPFSDPSFNFLTCNVLDTDGRSRSPTRLGFLASLAGAGKVSPSATANLQFQYNATSETEIRNRLGIGSQIQLHIRVSITTIQNGNPVDAGPYEFGSFELEIAMATDTIAVVSNPDGVISIPISTVDRFSIDIEVRDITTDTIVGSGSILFDPGTALPVITHGSVREVVVDIVS